MTCVFPPTVPLRLSIYCTCPKLLEIRNCWRGGTSELGMMPLTRNLMEVVILSMVALIASGCAASGSADSKSMLVSDQNAVRWAQLVRRSHALTATREGLNYEYAFGRSLELS
jgi:hypothetical protein